MCFLLVLQLEFRSGSGAVLTFVAMTTSSLGTFNSLRILPSTIYASPAPYSSAVSKWLIPFLRATSMMRLSSS